MSENKTNKYLTYALGEIILVVVGILIALQVNNWNENRNAKQHEKLVLQELSNNLDLDIQDLKHNLKRDSLSINSLNTIIKIIDEDIPYNDSMAIHFGRMSYFTNFINNTSSYENMKSDGFNVITNDSLRFKIIKYYEHDSKLLKKVENEFINNNQNQFVKPFMMLNFNYNSMFNPAFPLNYSELIRNPELRNIASTMSKYFLWKVELSNSCLTNANQLKFYINTSLKH